MRLVPTPLRRASLVLMAACAVLPTLVALVVVGLGAAAPAAHGLSQATGAFSGAAAQGLDRRALELAPLFAHAGLAFGAIDRIDTRRAGIATEAVVPPSSCTQLPLRL